MVDMCLSHDVDMKYQIDVNELALNPEYQYLILYSLNDVKFTV